MNSRDSRRFGLLAAGITAGTLVVTATVAASPSFATGSDTAQTFAATGGVQTWTVPTGVTQLYVDISGAQGGAAYGGGGAGAELTGTISVTPGETLNIVVGGMGQNGSRYSAGAGGGGGSFIYTTADQSGILAAAGGGGGAGSNTFPSAASTGTSGMAGGNGGGAGGTGGNGGGSGTAGGGGGLLTNGGGSGGGHSVAGGASGGAGGYYGAGGFGGGGGTNGYAGAGGGGYSGGGGGTYNGNNGGGGGGGSYFSGTLTGAVNNHGGNGSVTLYYPSNLTSVSPAAGAPGTSVTIDGSGLTGATVAIGGVAATVTSSTDTQVVATVPAPSPLPTGLQTVSVTTAGGVTLPAVGAFTYLAPPVFTADSPPSTATVGTPYTYTYTASGRPAPSFAVSSGTLPAGLTLTSGGVLSGTPTASGDSTFTVTASNGVSPDASSSTTITVGQAAQTITFAPLTSPATVGDTQTLTASGGPSGNPVYFTVAPTTTGSACSVSGTTLSFDNAGTCVVAADQDGNADYAAATEVTQTVTVALAPTSVSVALSSSGSVFGQDVTATATPGGPQAGSVQFSVDGTNVGAPVTVSNGQATSPAIGTLPPGGHQVGAVFTPLEATKYASSTATPQTLVVDQAATTSTITVRAGSLSAAITPVSPGAGTPSGTVTFTVDGTPVGTATLDAGTATATLNYALPTGKADQVAVQYAGDANFLPSSASTTRQDPTITVTLTSAQAKNASGWYRTPVTAHFTCTTNGAALVSACPQPVTLSNDGAAQSVSRTITAVDGGAATVSVTGINIDQTRPTVSISGVEPRMPYFASAPIGQCTARDGLSGIASCSITHRRSGARVIYTATAVDKAGNVSTTQLTARVAKYMIQGAGYQSGVYVVHAGHTYTMLATATSRPRYVDAMPFPRAPHGLDNLFIKSGRNRWALGVTFSNAMLRHRDWHIGVRVDGRTHVLTVRVIR